MTLRPGLVTLACLAVPWGNPPLRVRETWALEDTEAGGTAQHSAPRGPPQFFLEGSGQGHCPHLLTSQAFRGSQDHRRERTPPWGSPHTAHLPSPHLGHGGCEATQRGLGGRSEGAGDADRTWGPGDEPAPEDEGQGTGPHSAGGLPKASGQQPCPLKDGTRASAGLN